jgi:hypothetical protein
MVGQPLLAYRVAWIGRVLTAVELDNDVLLAADKVDEIRPDRALTNKFESAERTRLQSIPELRLGVGRIGSEISSAHRGESVCITHAGAPSPGSLRDPTSPRRRQGYRNGRDLYLFPLAGRGRRTK